MNDSLSMAQPRWIILGIIIIGIIVFLISYITHARKNNNSRQAVFLNNGEVYFGNVDNPNTQFVSVRNVYYLQPGQKISTLNGQNPNVSIIKLGDEVQKPQDQIFINRDTILYYENMQNDSKVNQAIQTFLDAHTSPKPSPSPSPSV